MLSLISIQFFHIVDVCGDFQALMNRVENVNKNHGPFDLLLFMGKFTSQKFPENEVLNQLEPYINGQKKS